MRAAESARAGARDQIVRAKMGWSSVRGRIEEFRGDTLRLRTGPGGVVHRDVPITATTRIDLRAGRASRTRGALIGAGAGAMAGLMLGIMISDAFNGTVAEGAAISPSFMPYTIAGGVVFGALVPGDRWTRVRLTPR